MKTFLARNGIYFAAAIVVALFVHAATVFMLPHFIMAQTMRKIVRDGVYNVVRHVARADEHSRVVVRPSPDLLYSICPFDLSKGDLRVQAEVPPGTYWSVSVFDADTNNIFVENDRQAKDAEINYRNLGKAFQRQPEYEGKVEFVIFRAGLASDQLEPPHWIPSPTAKGLVLFRTLINDESRFAEIDAARRKATCEVYNLKS
ncbi:MAG: DUF1254 domain-containing protein [Rhizomicrobium sp.]